jgi:hypothetical protein
MVADAFILGGGIVGFVSIFLRKTTASATRMVVSCSCFKIESVDVTGEGEGMDHNGSIAENIIGVERI